MSGALPEGNGREKIPVERFDEYITQSGVLCHIPTQYHSIPDDYYSLQTIEKKPENGVAKIIPDDVEGHSYDSLDMVMREQIKLFKRPLTSVKEDYKFQPVEFGKIQSSQLFDVDVKPPDDVSGKRISLSGEWMEKSRKPLGKDLKPEEFDHTTKIPEYDEYPIMHTFQMTSGKPRTWARKELSGDGNGTNHNIENEKYDYLHIEVEEFVASLHRGAGVFEPLFVKMALYDDKERISEFYHFSTDEVSSAWEMTKVEDNDENTEKAGDIKKTDVGTGKEEEEEEGVGICCGDENVDEDEDDGVEGQHGEDDEDEREREPSPKESDTRRKRCVIFRIPIDLSSFFLVVMVSKCAQGDLGPILSAYANPSLVLKKQKRKEEVVRLAKVALEKLHGRNAQQLLCWKAIQINWKPSQSGQFAQPDPEYTGDEGNEGEGEEEEEEEEESGDPSKDKNCRPGSAFVPGIVRTTSTVTGSEGMLDVPSSSHYMKRKSSDFGFSTEDRYWLHAGKQVKGNIVMFFGSKSCFSESQLVSALNASDRSLMKNVPEVPILMRFVLSRKSVHFGHLLRRSSKGSSRADEAHSTMVAEEFFSCTRPNLWLPFRSYRHEMFIRFRSANLRKKARNICVGVSVKDNDESLEGPGLPALWDPLRRDWVDVVYSGMSYHKDTPDFVEEWKIRIPVTANEKTHVLFTFYQISCRKKLKGEFMVPVAYSWFPLISDGIIVNGKHKLDAYQSGPTGQVKTLYTDSKSRKSIWIGKQPITIDVIAKTSVIPVLLNRAMCVPIREILELAHAPSKRIGQCHIETLIKDLDPEQLVRFLPLIVDSLIRIILRGVTPVGEAFEKLVHVCVNVAGSVCGRNVAVLEDYVVRHFVNDAFEDIFQSRESDLQDEDGMEVQRTQGGECDHEHQQEHQQEQEQEQEQEHGKDQMHTGDIDDDKVGGKIEMAKDESFFSLLARVWRLYLEYVGKCIGSQVSVASVTRTPSSGKPEKEKVEAPDIRYSFEFSWFFFGLMRKSMILESLSDDKERTCARFQHFLDEFEQLAEAMAQGIVYHAERHLIPTRLVNNNIALFIRDAMSISGMPRGRLMKIVGNFIDSIDRCRKEKVEKEKSEMLAVYGQIGDIEDMYRKIDFLDLLAEGNPHLFHLSCPVVYFEEEKDLKRTQGQHFLLDIIIDHLCILIQSSTREIREKGLDVLMKIFARHESSHYSSLEEKQAISDIFFRFVVSVVEDRQDIQERMEKRLKELKEQLENVNKEVERQESLIRDAEEADEVGEAKKSERLSILKDLKARQERQEESLMLEEQSFKRESRKLQLCILFVIHTMNQKLLADSWRHDMGRLRLFLPVLGDTVQVMKYVGKDGLQLARERGSTSTSSSDVRELIEENIGRSAADRRTMGFRERTRVARMTLREKHLTMKKAGTLRKRQTRGWGVSSTTSTADSIVQLEDLVVCEKALWSNVVMILLDLLDRNVLQVVSEYDRPNVDERRAVRFISLAFDVMEKLIDAPQSTETANAVFLILRRLICVFQHRLSNDMEKVQRLCVSLLKSGDSRILGIRRIAAATLYLVTRIAYMEHGESLARLQIQLTKSLSGIITQIKEGDHLKYTLGMCKEFVKVDRSLREAVRHSLERGIVYVMDRLSEILEFRLRIISAGDEETKADLEHGVADSYSHTPDLRVTWLKNLAKRNEENGNYAEAGQCYMFVAFLIFEVLKVRKVKTPLILLEDVFHRISPALHPNDEDEKKKRNEWKGVLLMQEERDGSSISKDKAREVWICDPADFSEETLDVALSHACAQFNRASMWEIENDIFKLRIAMRERARDWETLGMWHMHLAELCGKIRVAIGGKTRSFGTYYYVRFHGDLLDFHLRGGQFVYKVPGIVRLADMKKRLLDSAMSNSVEKIEASQVVFTPYGGIAKSASSDNVVGRDSVVIELQTVQPYFGPRQMQRNGADDDDDDDAWPRSTDAEQNTNVKIFSFDSAFTDSGRSHGPLSEQKMRRTIITTEFAFPYLRTRAHVLEAPEVIELDPLDNAIELVRSRNDHLANIISTPEPDVNMLQLALQGSVRAAVNGGIPDIVKTFLDDPNTPYSKERLFGLPAILTQFCLLCQRGLAKDDELVRTGILRPFHLSLEEGFQELQALLSPHFAGVENGVDVWWAHHLDYIQTKRAASSDDDIL
eukprot:TRINITY_DN184_c2_g1_i1.p1 TRINITY_DN184_c2_g1~~TRINITY_DN184_c2_g1_i1.p1  ORF type:complete len:2166 (-),score=651.29 TRINITY_DN184_c2_g1_i1:169-6666(-)